MSRKWVGWSPGSYVSGVLIQDDDCIHAADEYIDHDEKYADTMIGELIYEILLGDTGKNSSSCSLSKQTNLQGVDILFRIISRYTDVHNDTHIPSYNKTVPG